MRVKILTLLAGAGAFAAVAIPALVSAAPGDKVELNAKLDEKQEVPGPGDTDGKGSATFKLNSNKGKICFEISYQNIEEPNAGHIHKGPKGDDGPIKVELFADTGFSSPIEDCVEAEEKVIDRIANNPERFYVNLHNTEFPDGAIRGQLKGGGGGGGDGSGGGGGDNGGGGGY
jgi:CHRD domain